TLADTIELALWLKERNMRPRQVQDFIPTPMAIATAMYFTGLDPLTGKPVHVARDLREKRMMKALLFYWDPQHWPLAREALIRAGRRDLIGKLIPDRGEDLGRPRLKPGAGKDRRWSSFKARPSAGSRGGGRRGR
ncbi:MAG TPA: DUF3362 domain-containing protein, partial [Gemmatimonadaceae bacterium]|nr:DUF3362 domain-containing protein [Gemmatimonadaceae bacterium]